MRFHRVLLLSPPSHSRYGGLRVPAGIGYVAQALQDAGIGYEYLDMRVGHGRRELQRVLERFRPDLVGVSMITLEYLRTYRLLSEIKALLPAARIVVGGHHVTILRDKVLRDCPAIDFGVVGEGEGAMVDLCRDRLALHEIPGLLHRDNAAGVVFNGEREPAPNLDECAFPRYSGFRLGDYSKQIPVNSSRGCVGQCTFCPNKVLGRRYRERSVDHFVDELEHWYRRGYSQFAIDDDNFTLNRKRVFAICDEIERRDLKGLMIRCSNGIRADRVDRELLARMKQIGVREVGFGVDGGNNKVLGYLKKGESIETIESAIRDACDLGLDVKIFIIVGTPGETLSDIEDSIALARRYPVARVNFNNAIPYPGTELYDYVAENKLFLIPPERYLNEVAEERGVPVFETPELPRQTRVDMLKRCHRVEAEVMRNTAARMVQGHPLAQWLTRRFFHVQLFETLFFKNLAMRNLVERVRYRALMQR